MALGAVGGDAGLLRADARPSCSGREDLRSQQAIRHRLAEIALELEAGRDVTYAALRRHVAGEDAVREVTIAKLRTQRSRLRRDRRLPADPRARRAAGARAGAARRPPGPDRRRHRRDHEGDPGPLAGPLIAARMVYARDGVDSTRGQLLIAGPGLLDPNFWRTVVLIVEHSDEGALGLVLNRPSETTVGEAVSELEELLDLDDPLYVGGPVQPSALIVLAEFDRPADAALIAFEDVGVLANGAQEDPSLSVRRGRAFVGPRRVGPRPARRRGRARRLDPRAGPARGRLHRHPAGAVGVGADAQGRQLRAGGADAARPVGELSRPSGPRPLPPSPPPRAVTRDRAQRAQGRAGADRRLHAGRGHRRACWRPRWRCSPTRPTCSPTRSRWRWRWWPRGWPRARPAGR